MIELEDSEVENGDELRKLPGIRTLLELLGFKDLSEVEARDDSIGVLDAVLVTVLRLAVNEICGG